MLELFFFFPVKLFLILNTATVTDITTDHDFHGRTDIKTFPCTQRSHSGLVHSVGKWRALGLEGLSVSPSGMSPGTGCGERCFDNWGAARRVPGGEHTWILHGCRRSDLRLLL